jgi:hypothetical protein
LTLHPKFKDVTYKPFNRIDFKINDYRLIKCRVDLAKRIHRLYSRDISEIPLDSSTAPSGKKVIPERLPKQG